MTVNVFIASFWRTPSSVCLSEITAILACSTEASASRWPRHLLVDELEVVVDVTEERHQAARDLRIDPALQALERSQQGMDRTGEVGRLTTQPVDPLGRRGRATEHDLLDLVDVLLEAGDDRRVVVDDLVEDRPQHGACTQPQQVGPALQMQPGGVQVGHLALAHGDHEPRREEHGHLAECHLLALIVVLGRAHDREQDFGVLVELDLRPQMKRLRVLDREFVEPEMMLEIAQLRLAPVRRPRSRRTPRPMRRRRSQTRDRASAARNAAVGRGSSGRNRRSRSVGTPAEPNSCSDGPSDPSCRGRTVR